MTTYAKLLKMAALQPRLLANEDVELYVAGKTNLKELCNLGLKPKNNNVAARHIGIGMISTNMPT